MEYTPPTYEEYVKATTYAKVRYKFGVYIQAIAFILLIILLIYTVTNVEEMKANPLSYAEEQLDIFCICQSNLNSNLIYNSNGNVGSNRNIGKE